MPLHDLDIFMGLSPDEIKISLEKCTTNTYKKGQAIFKHGNLSYGLYSIKSGKVKISHIGSDGKETILRLVATDEILDYSNLLNNEVYTSSAIALEDCVVFFIDKEYFLDLIKRNPIVTINIIKKISQTMAQVEVNQISLSHKNVRERLAALILKLGDQYGVIENNIIRLDIKLSREELSAMIGTTHETLVRLMTEFKSEEIIEEDAKIIFIVNKPKLIKFANS
jgi:CRP/FNR family transcriptional regulator